MTSSFFNQDHESIRDMARDFAESALAPVSAEIDESGEFPRELLDTIGEMGFLGLKIPEEYGGAGMDTRTYVLVMEETAKKSAIASVYISGTNSLASAPILLAGTEEQKQKYLPGIASGKEYMAFALTEPGAGSDAASMLTRAVEDGDDYVLNGRKCFITGAPIADNALVFAKTNPEKGARGITSFLVDMRQPGISCGKHEDKMGIRGLPTSDLLFEDVRVPKSAILGKVDEGFTTAMRTLSVGRIGIAAQSLGIAQGAMDLAVRHIKERQQFGRPLAAFQGLRFMIADMETQIEAARLLTYNAAWLLDMKQNADKAASMAKLYASEAAVQVVGKALQLHGGYGYSREYEIERLYRDVRITTIYEGTSQVQQMVIAGQVLR